MSVAKVDKDGGYPDERGAGRLDKDRDYRGAYPDESGAGRLDLKEATGPRIEADAAAEQAMFRRPSEWRIFWEAFSRDRLAVGAAAVIGLVCLASVLAPILSPYDPTVGDNSLRLAPIGTPGHVLGLDGQGRDILSRLLWGGRVSLIIALLPVAVASVISVLLGLVAGFAGGKVDMIIMRTLDVFFAFPAVLLAVAIAGVLGPGMLNVMLSLTIVLVPYISRVAYMATVTVKNELFVDQARVSGARPAQILFHHILPNTLSPVIVYGSTLVGIMIVLGAGLSFLGLGITPPRPDWGIMCADGRNFLSVAPHVSAVPGIVLILVAMSFNIVGDGLRDALDPKLRK